MCDVVFQAADRPRLEGDRGAIDARRPAPSPTSPALLGRPGRIVPGREPEIDAGAVLGVEYDEAVALPILCSLHRSDPSGHFSASPATPRAPSATPGPGRV